MSTPLERMSRRTRVLAVLVVLLVLLCLALTWLFFDRPGRSGSGGSGGSGELDAESLAFTISGDAAGLVSPGVMVPLDLSLANPHQQAIAVRELTVRVQELEAPNASATLPCTLDDFAVQQFSGLAEFVVAATQTASLSDLGIPTAQWPEVGMHDRPVNQDGCKGASLTLRYTANGQAVNP